MSYIKEVVQRQISPWFLAGWIALCVLAYCYDNIDVANIDTPTDTLEINYPQ